MFTQSIAIPVDNIHVKYIESDDIERLKSMVKESAVMMMSTILNVDFESAERFYTLIFKK